MPGVPGPNQTNGPSKGLFYPMMQNWAMYMCPLHKTNSPFYVVTGVKFTSYLMNGAVIDGSSAYEWSSGAIGKTFKNSAFKGSDMMFWESDEKEAGNFNDGASRPSEGLTQRHAFGAMFGFFDGHAEFVKWKRWTQLIADPRKNSLWCFPNSITGR